MKRSENIEAVLAAWNQAKASGTKQVVFAHSQGISDRTLRSWVKAYGTGIAQLADLIGQAESVTQRIQTALESARSEITRGVETNPETTTKSPPVNWDDV